MRINPVLAAISFAFAIACPETTSAFPKCNIPDCSKLDIKYSRATIGAACKEHGGIETGTTAKNGGYSCYVGNKYVECDDKGQCVGGGMGKSVPPGSRQLESILGEGARRPESGDIKK